MEINKNALCTVDKKIMYKNFSITFFYFLFNYKLLHINKSETIKIYEDMLFFVRLLAYDNIYLLKFQSSNMKHFYIEKDKT